MTRLTTSEVCALGRFSRATLWRRVAAGTLPAPIDQAREAIFDRERVMGALAVTRPRWRAGPKSALAVRGVSKSIPRNAEARRWTRQRWDIA